MMIPSTQGRGCSPEYDSLPVGELRHFGTADEDHYCGRGEELPGRIAGDKPSGEVAKWEAVPASPSDGLVLGAGKGIKLMLIPDTPAESTPAEKKKQKPHPQTKMNKLWANFDPDHYGKVTRILPNRMTDKPPATTKAEGEIAHNAVRSYDQAKESCIRDVERIIKECRQSNQKYTDSHFDIERDLKITRAKDCLVGLTTNDKDKKSPSDAKRVTDIFEKPQFFANGTPSNDILQGSIGDCWFLAAISALSCNPEFIQRVCVIQDQIIGVYGFVFYRDGEWHQCIIDDKLYLRAPHYDESGDVVLGQYGLQRTNQEEEYRDLFQRGSRALYFAQCRDQNETWISLLEKAYAKAHGDYASTSGGQTGEALEDLTGGVTTEIYSTNILDVDAFWNNELSRIGKDFIFSCAVASWREWLPFAAANSSVREERRSGIVSAHAYSVLGTYEGHGQRLVKIRNPWGRKEWTGPWSDGSNEWTAEWIERLNHKFGDDGIFWMSYKDMLQKYKYIDRTRIFDASWHVAQQWLTVQVPWSALDYQAAYFSIDVPNDTAAVIVLSQLDHRYFKGLQGQYRFVLQFRIHNEAESPEEYIARSRLNYELVRSVNVEVHLPKGRYTVLIKVEAYENGCDDVESVIRANIARRDKITQIGKLYDLAHQKGRNPVTKRGSSAGEAKAGEASEQKTGELTEQESERAPSESEEYPSPPQNENEEDPLRKPWNAACVVGLRVYSHEPDLGLKVVYPAADEESKGPSLDRDDVAKGAQDEANIKGDKPENEEEGVTESKITRSQEC